MAGKSSAAETPVEPVTATGTPEPVAPPAEPAQEISASEVESLKKQIADAAVALEALTKQRNDAVANALRADAQYKGLQSQTTKTLQQAAKDRRDLALAQMQAAEVGDIKSLLNTLAEKVLDEDEAKQLKYTQRELELNRRAAAIEAAKIAPVEEPVVEPQQYTNPTDEKARFLSYYFPGLEIDPNDPNIDWAGDAPSQPEAMKRFVSSVMKIKDSQESSKANDAITAMQKQTAEQLDAFKKQIEDLTSKTAEEVAAARTAAEAEARKDAEKRLRAMGADVSGAAPSDGSGRKTFGQQVEESLNDDLLRTPEGRKQYAKNLEAIQKQVRERFQR